VAGIWGQTRNLGDRTLDAVDLSRRRSVGPGWLWRPDMGTDTMSGTRYGDRHGVRYADQERSTSNAQLSTFIWVTERAHGGRDMGTDTEFGRADF